MKKTTLYGVVLFVTIAAMLLTACSKKDNQTSTQVNASQVSSASFISQVQRSMKGQMSSAVYNDLDWQNALVSSLDNDHTDNLMQVRSKRDLKTSLYYSIMDNKVTSYLVTIGLPGKITTEEEVNGTIETRTIKNVLIKRFTVKNNKVVKVEYFDGSNTSMDKQDGPDPNCPDCTLPECVVMSYSGGTSIAYYSMFYTFGSGEGGKYIPGPVGQYGSGGGVSSPYYDKYSSKTTSATFQNPFLRKNPNQQNGKFIPVISKETDKDLYIITDNKTFWNFNVTVKFYLDKNNKLIVGTYEVKLTGFIVGSYIPDNLQPQYVNYGDKSLTFDIAGEYSYGVGSFDVPLNVHLYGIGTSSVAANIHYPF